MVSNPCRARSGGIVAAGSNRAHAPGLHIGRRCLAGERGAGGRVRARARARQMALAFARGPEAARRQRRPQTRPRARPGARRDHADAGGDPGARRHAQRRPRRRVRRARLHPPAQQHADDALGSAVLQAVGAADDQGARRLGRRLSRLGRRSPSPSSTPATSRTPRSPTASPAATTSSATRPTPPTATAATATPPTPAISTDQSSALHGTHVAGIIAANTNNGVGVAGLDWSCQLVIVRALGISHGTGVDSDIADAIRWAAGLHVDGVPDNPHPADVINMSFGGSGFSQTMQDAVNDAVGAGAIIVAAAGNLGDRRQGRFARRARRRHHRRRRRPVGQDRGLLELRQRGGADGAGRLARARSDDRRTAKASCRRSRSSAPASRTPITRARRRRRRSSPARCR